MGEGSTENQVSEGKEHSFRIKNSRDSIFVLGFEPWGWFWDLAPGDEYEAVFDDAKDFWSVETIDCTNEHIVFWAVYPTEVYWLKPQGKVAMMGGKA
ncbi:MAG: hypothetical protein KY445_10435 [Armatimonadetes bacterium]|nr:hypothetical protein [Armatimonadota bacterium]